MYIVAWCSSNMEKALYLSFFCQQVVDQYLSRLVSGVIAVISDCDVRLFVWFELFAYLHEPRHDKTYLREFPTRPDTNQAAQPQKLATVLKFRL